MSFVYRTPVRFAHCDPAGIAYFPRLFELVDAAVEDWTAAVIGVSRATMHGEQRLGMPMVDMHASFATPCRLGDTLAIALTITDVGTSSVELSVAATTGDTTRFTMTLKQVLMNLDTAKASPWPDAWRRRLTA